MNLNIFNNMEILLTHFMSSDQIQRPIPLEMKTEDLVKCSCGFLIRCPFRKSLAQAQGILGVDLCSVEV